MTMPQGVAGNPENVPFLQMKVKQSLRTPKSAFALVKAGLNYCIYRVGLHVINGQFVSRCESFVRAPKNG